MSRSRHNGPRPSAEAMEIAEEARSPASKSLGFCRELFAGNFRFDLIYPFPDQSPEDKALGDETVRRVLEFLEKSHDPLEADRTRVIPEPVMQGLRDLGLFGIKIPKEYGGLGFSQVNYNRVIHAVASHSPSIAVMLSAHQSIGVPQPLLLFGTEAQKKRWLPRLAKGEISAFALTEVGVGSDPAQMKMTASPVEGGRYWLLNGEKLWTTNGPIASLLVVMAVTPPLILPEGKEKKQITAFVVETDTPGFSIRHRCDFMGLKAIQNGLLRFENVKVPAENILWETGKGLKLALTTLNTGRLTLPAACTAAGRVCLGIARAWARERIQWGGPLGSHEMSAAHLVFAAGASYAMEAVGSLGAALSDRGEADLRIEAALAKLFSTGLGWRVVDATVQLRGGRGYETAESLRARGEDAYPVEQAMRDFRINTIIEGSSEIQRLFVAREALDRHVEVAGGLFDRKKNLRQKASVLIAAIGFYALWYPRLWIPDVFRSREPRAGGWEGGSLRFVSRLSRRIARTVFHALLLNGPGLERRQLALKRIVDTAMFLFGLAAVLSRYLSRKRAGELHAHEGELVRMICRSLEGYARESFRKIRIRPGKSEVLALSQAVMAGELSWLEEDVCDVVGLSKAARAERSEAA